MMRVLLVLLLLAWTSAVEARGGGSWTNWAKRRWIPRDRSAVITLSPATLTSGTLTTWNDDYGGANNVTQGTAANRPTISVDSRGTGRHGVLFDGSNDNLKGTFTINQPFTIGILYKSVVVGNLVTNDIIFDGSATLDAMVSAADVANVIYNFGASQNTSVLSPTANGTYERWMAIGNSSSSSVYKNGSSVFSGNLGTNNPGGVTIACLRDGTRCTNIEVGALVMFPSALGAADLTALDWWLSVQ